MLAVILVLAAAAAALLAVSFRPSPPPDPAPAVHVQLASSTATLGDRVLNAAETQKGCWYSWAGAGPCSRGYDCSGLVAWAASHAGVYAPHSTYSMLGGTGHLYRIPLSEARRGDLMFYGSGHVEIMTRWYHTTFGAEHTGTRVGWHRWSEWWHPTEAMRFR